ncbi:MAG: hypothetical protein SFX73_25720 [Kofleriaceae bacterium]|nr:hypothetical protein [Kofleriaceae bacterium]
MLGVTCLLAAACGSPDERTAPPSIRFRLGDEGVLPAPLDVPFPSDIYRDESGRIVSALGSWANLGVRNKDALLDSGFAGLDGFGRTVGAIFLIDGVEPLDAATVSQGCALVDIDPSSPTFGQLVDSEARYIHETRTLVIQPRLHVLAPGRRYAAVVGTDVMTSSGTPLAPQHDLATILAGTREHALASVYADALPALEVAGISADRIAGLTVFTSQNRHRLMRQVRDQLVAGDFGPAPTLVLDPQAAAPATVTRFGRTAHPSWTATLDAWLGDAPQGEDGLDLPGTFGVGGPTGPRKGIGHDAIGVVFSAAMPAPELRRAFTKTSSPEDGTIAFDGDGHPVVVDPDVSVPVTFILPRTTPPPSGWPVVLFGHGTPVHRAHMMGAANELARAGFAVVAIDAPEHGLRTRSAEDFRSSYEGTYDGPDGFADAPEYVSTTLALLGDAVNLARARDTRLQTIVDYCQLRRLVANPALDLSFIAEEYGGIAPKLDGQRILWAGVSYGAFNGLVMAAVEPTIGALLLDVGGGLEYVTIGEAPSNLRILDLFLPLIGLPSSQEVPMSRFHPLLTLLQMMEDSLDPASFARDINDPSVRGAPPPDLYLLQVDHDELVPNYGSAVIVAELGLPQIAASPVRWPPAEVSEAPVIGNVSGRTQAVMVQGIGAHGFNLLGRMGERIAEPPFPRDDAPAPERVIYLPSAVKVRQPVVATQRSMVRFFTTSLTGAAEIDVAGMETWLDFDDDGWTDEEEGAAGTRPFDPSSHPAGAPPHPRTLGF